MNDTAWVLVLAFAVCLVLGALGACVGQLRAHAVIGFWLGFLLGPLGVLIAALVPDDR